MLSKFIKILSLVNICALFLLIISFLPTQTSAQTGINLQFALSHELNIEVSPTYPRPNSSVSINLTLYTADLNSAEITWLQDGKVALKGIGKTSYSFKTGPIGTETKLEIDIGLLSGTTFTKTLTFNPTSVDLVWEADSYVPPFYKGKALHPAQGVIKIVAVPEFVTQNKRTSSENLIYTWSNDVSTYQDQSGYGKNVFILNGSLLGRDENVKVLVTDPVNNLTAQGFLTIKPVDPEIVFYENDPYYGHIFDSAITNPFSLNVGEVQILAIPYYFTRDNSIKDEWRLNREIVPGLTDSMTAIFKKPQEGTGQSLVSLQVTNPNRLLQSADASLIMNFENR
jgi:hypothetical protein